MTFSPQKCVLALCALFALAMRTHSSLHMHDRIHMHTTIHTTAALDDPPDIIVQPSGVRVYQSALQKSIVIDGRGFAADMSLTLDPPLLAGVDYYVTCIPTGQLQLQLNSGKKWRQDAGPLYLKHISSPDREQSFGGDAGVRIAQILADPVITASEALVHNTQTKIVTIHGHGFTNIPDMKVTLGIASGWQFKVIRVTEDTMQWQLKPNEAWNPSLMNLSGERRIPLLVTVIDTGAGDVSLADPVTVGYVVADMPYAVCDDSCEFAYDGVCDDIAQKLFHQHHQASYTGIPPCVNYTDCTDCGGVDAVVGPQCTNTCQYARDNVCDYPWMAKHCDFGTDCEDCGPLNADDNYTTHSVVHAALESTSQSQLVYNDAPSIIITGVVADATGQFLRWSNTALDSHVEYVVNATARVIEVHKYAGIPWMESGQTLPAVLSVAAVKEYGLTGDEDGTFTQVDVPIAIVFEALAVFASSTTLSAMQSEELHIKGTGFPTSPDEYSIALEFSPPLEEGVDYTVRLSSRTDLYIVLNEGHSWRASPGTLLVTAVNTLGTEDGWLAQGEEGAGVCVALVQRNPVSMHGAASSPLMKAAEGVFVFAILVPIVVCTFCTVSAAFRRIETVTPTGLNETEFELTRAKPMSVTAADMIMGTKTGTSYSLVPEEQNDYDEV